MSITPLAETYLGVLPAPTPPQLLDRFGRSFTYLRIAVTDRCQLRCIYCMPEAGIDFTPSDRLLTTEEILRLVGVAASLGVFKVRFTGGEPLLRRDMVELIRGAARTPGITSVNLTTNGLLFKDRAMALLRAGLTGINISLDTLDAAKFARITRRQGVEQVLAALEAALAVGIPAVKLNVVALQGFNDTELGDFGLLTRDEPITVRFIELMPFDAHQIWKTGRHMSAAQIKTLLAELYPRLDHAVGTATEQHIYRIPGHLGKLAIIPAYTRSLCGSCNRIRLTADGCIRNCLYSEDEYSLRELMRSGATDGQLARILTSAMRDKHKDGWVAQRAAKDTPESQRRDSMTQIGG
ncbi:MAG: GTP 3',8-cyclase MoaA [Candidatus Marinimicrobia bacterium]|nr:GTP 3',8-cyclase MoaA [Candidatus Neomarinimicrobiota bacterium]